jgi:hypothetical protein
LTKGQHFWDLMSHLVETLYATHPSERLGLCRPILAEEFPHLNRPSIQKLENTVLRLVAWMCEMDKRERIEQDEKATERDLVRTNDLP